VDSVVTSSVNGTPTLIVLKRNGDMPMPIEVEIETTDGKFQYWYISIDLMRNMAYSEEGTEIQWIAAPAWSWVQDQYIMQLPLSVKKVTIDPYRKIADVERGNNMWPIVSE
jgi:hypothetical protein